MAPTTRRRQAGDDTPRASRCDGIVTASQRKAGQRYLRDVAPHVDATAAEEAARDYAYDEATYLENLSRIVFSNAARDDTPSDILRMSDEQYYDSTKASEGTRRRDHERAVRLKRLEQIVAGCTAGALTCRKCHGDKISIQQKQTRSADEGMTVFCKCDACGTQWRMS